jgi:hypothetical protein
MLVQGTAGFSIGWLYKYEKVLSMDWIFLPGIAFPARD